MERQSIGCAAMRPQRLCRIMFFPCWAALHNRSVKQIKIDVVIHSIPWKAAAKEQAVCQVRLCMLIQRQLSHVRKRLFSVNTFLKIRIRRCNFICNFTYVTVITGLLIPLIQQNSPLLYDLGYYRIIRNLTINYANIETSAPILQVFFHRKKDFYEFNRENVKKEYQYQGKILKMRVDEVELPNGNTAKEKSWNIREVLPLLH